MLPKIAEQTRKIRKSITIVTFLSFFVPHIFLFRFFIENNFLSYQKCQQIHPKKEVLSNSWTSSENFFIKHLFQCKHASKTIEIKIKTRKFPYLISSRLELCDSLFNFIIHFLSVYSNSSLFFFVVLIGRHNSLTRDETHFYLPKNVL